MEIWSLKDIGVTTLTFLGSRDFISHVTILLGICGFLFFKFLVNPVIRPTRTDDKEPVGNINSFVLVCS